MANEEQLKILHQGVDVWNKWREENPNAKIDLTQANLCGSDFEGINLTDANLNKSDFSGGSLGWANLRLANLSETLLQKCFLGAINFEKANLIDANLSDTNLRRANLWGATLHRSNIAKSNFEHAFAGDTILNKIDLSQATGLEKVSHRSPSSISLDTITLSKGNIPEVFLRGCGLSDLDIEYSKLYNPDLSNEEINKVVYKIYDLRATHALQISPLFISYSHADKSFVDYLDTALTKKGVRFWRDVHKATAGRLESQIDRAIRQNPTMLLVLSKNSIKSDWVEHEVRTARQLEKELGRDAMCPIALDDGWKSSPWPKRVMEQVMEYNILDFSDWENQSAFERKFAKLLNGLDLFYKKAGG